MYVAHHRSRIQFIVYSLLIAAVAAARQPDDEADVNLGLDPDLAFLEEDPAAPDLDESVDDDEDDDEDEEQEDFEEDEDADLEEAEESLDDDDEDFEEDDEDLDPV